MADVLVLECLDTALLSEGILHYLGHLRGTQIRFLGLLSQDLPHKADVLVLECLDTALLSEGILHYLAHLQPIVRNPRVNSRLRTRG